MTRFDTPTSELLAGASAVAARMIREAIVGGRLKPGERLPEAELAEDLGISRTPIREALRQLQTEGLVEAPRNRGARVRVYSESDVDDLYQLRALLEGFAARRAATRVSSEQLAELRDACAAFETADPGDVDALLAANDRLHGIILDAAGSPMLFSVLNQITVIPRATYRAYASFSLEDHRSSVEDHRRLLQAIEQRDGELAELVVRGHVLQARDVVLPLVRAQLAGEAETAPS